MAARAKARRRSAKRREKLPRRRPWVRWSEDRLLDVRLCDLGVRIEGTWVASCVRELYDELAERGLRLRPKVWLSNEWFSPGGVPGIAIPFYLVHPRLMRLERSQMLEVEGGTREECLRILRHETGHALQHAYQVHRRRRWQELFGHSSKPYPELYRPNPASRRYVQHLRLYYAQSHPVEDFAETFAVWLQPRHVWRRRYEGWPALKKLEYVDELAEELRGTGPRVRSRMRVEPLSEIRTTLREHYAEKRERYSQSYPDIYDRDLRRVFSDDQTGRGRQLASAFIRRHRTEIRRIVSRWTGEHQFSLDQVMDDMIGRCRELGLRAVGPERRLLLDFSGMLAVRTVHFLYSRRNWIAL
jgi:Putative zinc-binding metallo-peptidase